MFYTFTRDAFRAAKIHLERFRQVSNVWTNQILVTLRWDGGLSIGQENVCRWFLN